MGALGDWEKASSGGSTGGGSTGGGNTGGGHDGDATVDKPTGPPETDPEDPDVESTLRITSPTDGQKVETGETVTIAWKATGAAADMDICLKLIDPSGDTQNTYKYGPKAGDSWGIDANSSSYGTWTIRVSALFEGDTCSAKVDNFSSWPLTHRSERNFILEEESGGGNDGGGGGNLLFPPGATLETNCTFAPIANSDHKSTVTLSIGEQITYTCNEGFHLQGSISRVMMLNCENGSRYDINPPSGCEENEVSCLAKANSCKENALVEENTLKANCLAACVALHGRWFCKNDDIFTGVVGEKFCLEKARKAWSKAHSVCTKAYDNCSGR